MKCKNPERNYLEKIENLSRIWSWSIMVAILSLSSSGSESRSPIMLLSILDYISNTGHKSDFEDSWLNFSLTEEVYRPSWYQKISSPL